MDPFTFQTLKFLVVVILLSGFALYFPYLVKDARQKKKKPAIIALNILLILFCAYVTWFSGSELYQWYSTGRLLYISRFHIPHQVYISYDQFPSSFIGLACFYVFAFLFFGGSGIIIFAKILRKIWKSYRDNSN
jgi:hypothetical protein